MFNFVFLASQIPIHSVASGPPSVKSRRRMGGKQKDWLAWICKLVVSAFLVTEAQAGSLQRCFYGSFGGSSPILLKTTLQWAGGLSDFVWYPFGSNLLAVYLSWPFSARVLTSACRSWAASFQDGTNSSIFWGIIHLASFTWHNVFNIYPWCCIYQ